MAAAIGGSVKIAEAITVVGDVSRVFDPSEDAAIIRSIREDMSDILQICQQKEQSAKDIIRDLTQSAAALEHQTAHSPEVAASKLAAEVEQQVHHTESQISALETHAADEHGKLNSLIDAERALDKLRDAELAKTASEVPTIRHQISLYACVSHLKWDFEAGQDICGHVFFRDPDEIRRFHIQPSDNVSEVQVADQLWELLAR